MTEPLASAGPRTHAAGGPWGRGCIRFAPSKWGCVQEVSECVAARQCIVVCFYQINQHASPQRACARVSETYGGRLSRAVPLPCFLKTEKENDEGQSVQREKRADVSVCAAAAAVGTTVQCSAPCLTTRGRPYWEQLFPRMHTSTLPLPLMMRWRVKTPETPCRKRRGDSGRGRCFCGQRCGTRQGAKRSAGRGQRPPPGDVCVCLSSASPASVPSLPALLVRMRMAVTQFFSFVIRWRRGEEKQRTLQSRGAASEEHERHGQKRRETE